MLQLSEVPIIQAPMSGGPSTPALTASVARAGGFGFIAAGYLTVDGLRQMTATTRSLVDGPFGINLFVPSAPGDAAAVARYAVTLQPEADRLGVALGDPGWDDDGFDAKLEVVESARVAVVSFTFGCPTPSVVDRMHRAGCQVVVTVTSAADAHQAAGAGADALAVQGTEAGGHQGGFTDRNANDRPLLSLLAELRETTDLPLIGASGIMTGLDSATALKAGAAAVQLGTAFLGSPEAGTSPTHRRALLDGCYPDTIVTRAYSGRFGRGLANEFAIAHHREAPRAYPEVHHLTRPIPATAARVGDASVPNLWAGTGWADLTTEPAQTIVRRIATEAAKLA